MTKVNVYSMDGTVKEKIDLPKIFDTPYRPDIIKKSFEVLHSNQRQPYGSDPMAGKRHAVASVGKGRGMSRVPRLSQGQAAALAPNVVGGRRAHPPKVERVWKEKMNKKENKLARNSAIAATAAKEIVTQRGHQFDEKITLPIIVDDDFEKIKKTKEVIEVLEKIGIYTDVLRSENTSVLGKEKCGDADTAHQNRSSLFQRKMSLKEVLRISAVSIAQNHNI
jgi:large subunit ribosomal protein L4e